MELPISYPGDPPGSDRHPERLDRWEDSAWIERNRATGELSITVAIDFETITPDEADALSEWLVGAARKVRDAMDR